MATAVLDLDFKNLPKDITGLDSYGHAYVLIRLQGYPVGKAWIPIVDGRIAGQDLRNAMMNGTSWVLWERWVHGYLKWDEVHNSNSAHRPATVAICTRDRPEELRRCLKALQSLPENGHEILVVDNGSTADATRRVVESFGSFRYVREETPGLNAARNRALREATHEIVAFTDDDAVPEVGWLDALLANFGDPQVLCVTGLTVPAELETEAQEWFERYNPFGRGFRRVVHDRRNRNLASAGRVGAGANMALRRCVVDRVGPFDESLDAGTPTRSGGDTEMFWRIVACRISYRI